MTMYCTPKKYINLNFFQCHRSVDYNDILFHIVGHHCNKSEHYMQDVLVEYLNNHMEEIAQVGREFLDCKGTNLEDYKDFINQDGKRVYQVINYMLICWQEWLIWPLQ